MRNPSSYDYCSPQEWADALREALFDAFADRDLQALFSREEIQERFSRFLPELERQEGWKFTHSIYSNRADSLAYALDPWNTLRSLRDEAVE
jgi:hypothetical protein